MKDSCDMMLHKVTPKKFWMSRATVLYIFENLVVRYQLSMDKKVAKSLQEWIGANPNVLPESIRDALMSASGASSNRQTDLLESGVRESPPSMADSISDESAESVPGSGEDRKDSEPAEELERDESQGILHEKPVPPSTSTSESKEPSPVQSSTHSHSDLPYTPEMYFSKKNNDARRKFRHVLRTAATEAKAYGVQTYRQLSTKQKHWITDRVIGECPELKGFERKISDAVIHMLIQAKQYLKRKKEGKVKRKSEKEDSTKNKSDKNPKDKSKSKQQSKESGKDKLKKTKVSTAKEIKTQQRGKGKVQTQQPLSEYEKMRQKNVNTMKAVLSAAMEHDKNSNAGIKPGDDVVLLHREVHLAKGYFIRDVDDMYAEVIFVQHLGVNEVDDVDLPHPVPNDSGHDKTSFSKLEKNDKFLWKKEKMIPLFPGSGASTSALPSSPRRSLRESHEPARFCHSLKAIYQDKKSNQ